MRGFDLYEIAKHLPGSSGEMNQARIVDQALVHQWWQGKLPERSSDALAALMKALHGSERWIACSCTDTPSDPPLLATFVRKGKFGLRRLTERAAHAPTCVFFTEQAVAPMAVRPSGVERGPIKPPVAPPAPAKEVRSQPGVQYLVDETLGADAESLRVLLFHMVDACHLNDVQALEKNPIALMLGAARTIVFNHSVHLDSILYCNYRAWLEGWMDKSFRLCAQIGVPQQALLICPVLGAKDGWVTLSSNGDRAHVGHISSYGDLARKSRYPMLMCARAMKQGDEAVLVSAYLHPIFSATNWMLVGSDLQRKTASVLIDCIEVLKAKGIEVILDRQVNPSTWAFDFVVSAVSTTPKQRSLCVQTLETDEPAYLLLRAPVVIDESMAKTFQDRRYLSDGHEDERLRRYVLGYFGVKD